MYETWRVERWDTPFSDVESLVMVKLVDQAGLSIVLEAPLLVGRPRWSIECGRAPAYRNIMEEYRIGLWQHLDETSQRCGRSFVVVNSPWVAEFHRSEPLLEFYAGAVRHFVVSTEDDVVEVLSASPPAVVALGPTDPDEPPAGKSILVCP